MDVGTNCKEQIRTRVFDTPCGPMIIGESAGKLCLCDWMKEEREDVRKRVVKYLGKFSAVAQGDSPALDKWANQITDWFVDSSVKLPDDIVPTGTSFQLSVWKSMRSIPAGTTMSYKELARAAGCPNAIRAVASACRANLLSIIIPCHRVVRWSGDIGEYAGGRDAKQWLLNHEGAKTKK